MVLTSGMCELEMSKFTDRHCVDKIEKVAEHDSRQSTVTVSQ